MQVSDHQLDGARLVVLKAVAGPHRWYSVEQLVEPTGLPERGVRLAVAWLRERELVRPRFHDQGIHPGAFYCVTTGGRSALENGDQLRLVA